MSGQVGQVKDTKRLYLVTEDGQNEKIVEAGSQAQAIKIVVGNRFKAEAASARDVARVMAEQYEREALEAHNSAANKLTIAGVAR